MRDKSTGRFLSYPVPPIEMVETPCGCGCGQVIIHKPLCPSQLRIQGPIRFVRGHQNRGLKPSSETIAKTRHPMETNGRWKGGRFIDPDGYALVKVPSHPLARESGYVLEHRLVMETILGRYLEPHEIVHHINSIKYDNRPENLQLVSGHAEHVRLERTGKKYPRKDGLWFICEHCGGCFYRSACWAKANNRFCSWSCRYPPKTG